MPHYNVFIQLVHNNTRETNNFLKHNNRYSHTRKGKKKKESCWAVNGNKIRVRIKNIDGFSLLESKIFKRVLNHDYIS